MAYVVARPNGRFEIRESVHTEQGPRARSLANFARLTDEVVTTARSRARRPFDADAVRASARRAGSPVAAGRRSTSTAPPRPPRETSPPRRALSPSEARRFVASSRRMAADVAASTRRPTTRRDPGDVLIDLLNFAEQVTPFTPARVPEPLGFPPLAEVVRAAGRKDLSAPSDDGT